MIAKGKEGRSCKQPCCAPKFGEEGAPSTDVFFSSKICLFLLSIHFSVPYPTR